MTTTDGARGEKLVAGVDSSTQSVKVELRSLADGTVVATGRAAHPPTDPPVSEQDPVAWWDALVAAFGEVRAHLADVVAVSVMGQQHGLVLLDGDGAPLRPALLWNDTRSAPQAAAMRDALGARWWANTVGVVPVASFTATKIAWVAEHEPELLARTVRIMLPHDYLTWRLTGAHVTDRGDASGSAWWSPVREQTVTAVLDLLGDVEELAAKVPRVLAPDAIAGRVTPDAAAALGLPEACLVAPGSGDNMGAALGLGLGAGDVCISLGTSGTVFGVSDAPVIDPTGTVAGFADAAGGFLPIVTTLNATKVTNAFAAWLGVDAPGLAALALEVPPAEAPLLVPYLDGERTPNLPEATGTMSGLRSGTSRAELARAAHVGVICGLLAGREAMEQVGATAPGGRTLLVGGGSRSDAYRRTLADLLQDSVVVPEVLEAVAAGGAVQAAAIVGSETPAAVAARWGLGDGEVVEPTLKPDAAAAVRAAYRAAAARVAADH